MLGQLVGLILSDTTPANIAGPALRERCRAWPRRETLGPGPRRTGSFAWPGFGRAGPNVDHEGPVGRSLRSNVGPHQTLLINLEFAVQVDRAVDNPDRVTPPITVEPSSSWATSRAATASSAMSIVDLLRGAVGYDVRPYGARISPGWVVSNRGGVFMLSSLHAKAAVSVMELV